MTDLQVLNVKGVDCYEKDGIAYLKLETVARGLGFTDNSKSTEYIRWNTVRQYLSELGFSQEVAKEGFIPENIFYRLAMKAKNETAEKFQALVADEIIPSIRKHGMYAVDELLDNPDLIIAMATQLKEEREAKKKLEIENAKKQREIEHKEDVIIGLVDEVELAQKRAILNRVVRYNHAKYQERWALLYREFENKYHINLSYRVDEYNKRNKPKKSKLEYIDKVMEKLPDLYEIACKLFENDVKALCKELYGIVG